MNDNLSYIKIIKDAAHYFSRNEKWALITLVLSLTFLAVSQGAVVVLVKGFLTALFDQRSFSDMIMVNEFLPQRLFDLFPDLSSISVQRGHLAILVPSLLLVAGLVKAMTTYLYNFAQQQLSLSYGNHLRERMFSGALFQSYRDFCRKPVAVWMSHIMNDVFLLQTRLSDVLTALVRDVATVAVCFAVLWFIHWPSALGLLIIGPILGLGMGRIGKKIAAYTETFQRMLALMANKVMDVRQRFDFVLAQNGANREYQQFEYLNSKYYMTMRQSILIRSAFAPALEFFGFCAFALFMYLYAYTSMLSDLPATILMQLFVTLGLILKPLKNIGEQFSRLAETRGLLAGGEEILSYDHSPVSHQLASPALESNHALGRSGGAAFKAVQIKDLSFNYRLPHGQIQSFYFNNFSVNPGEAIAIVGPSGGGKSTLLKICAGLIEPDQWDANIAWDTLAANTAYVSQHPFLFSDSIRHNLQYGCATEIRDEQLWRILEMVGLKSDLQKLPDGLDTSFRALQRNFSGGQLQRLAIARSMNWKKPIYLLDEATSALDAAMEKVIIQTMLQECSEYGRSLLYVTHRLKHLQKFNRICFLENGVFIFQGSYDEMLRHPRIIEFVKSGQFEAD